ncbi:MAG: PilZ domain-containing protein [Gammaproteobacteria bacterium]|nr:PilZ domain-containing protein [Gammaproteobacteria bacterium]
MDKRHRKRASLRGPVQVTLTNGRVLSGQGVDLSVSGLAFLSRDSLPPGTLLEVTFSVPSQGGPLAVTGLCEVIAGLFFSTSEGYRINARLLNTSDASRQGIRRFVQGDPLAAAR